MISLIQTLLHAKGPQLKLYYARWNLWLLRNLEYDNIIIPISRDWNVQICQWFKSLNTAGADKLETKIFYLLGKWSDMQISSARNVYKRI